jgi:hypothetical protein
LTLVRLQWLGAAALLVIAMVLGAIGFDDAESTAESIGAGFGVVILPLAITALIRAAYIRFSARGGGRPFWTPAVLAAAGTLALVASVALGISDEQDFAAAVDDCKTMESSPLEVTPAGFTLAELEPAQVASLTTTFESGGLPVEFTVQDLDARQVLQRNRPVAIALAYPGLGTGENRIDFEGGFIRGARDRNGSVDEIEIAGENAVLSTIPQEGATVATGKGCYALIVGAADEATAIEASRALLEADS